jgi:thiol:disulfide interchange protein DsbC
MDALRVSFDTIATRRPSGTGERRDSQTPTWPQGSCHAIKETPMKSIIVRISILAAAILGFAAIPATADEAAELQVVRDTVASLFDAIEEDDIFPSNVDGWYTIRKGAIVAYISGDGRYLLQGDLIDLEQQVNLSEQDRNKARVKMMTKVPDDQVILFTPQEVRHSISVFTDIDCTFCRRLHSQMHEYLDEGIEIRYFLYPRNGPASPSWAKAEQVWCADNRNEALTLAKLDKDFETHECDSSIVSAHYAMGQDVGLRGTPAIVLEDGTLFSGYMPPKQLAEAIASTLGD